MCDMGKGRRVVEYSGRSPGKGRGRGPRLWAFGYSELSRLLGVSETALRARVKRGAFDPGNLENVCGEWAKKGRAS